MRKAVVLTLTAVAAMMFSGCVAVVGKYTGPVEGGKKTTVGLIAIDSVGDGYPMIPFYTSFVQGK